MPTLRDNRGPLQAVPAGHPMTAPTLRCDGRGDISPFQLPTTTGEYCLPAYIPRLRWRAWGCLILEVETGLLLDFSETTLLRTKPRRHANLRSHRA